MTKLFIQYQHTHIIDQAVAVKFSGPGDPTVTAAFSRFATAMNIMTVMVIATASARNLQSLISILQAHWTTLQHTR